MVCEHEGLPSASSYFVLGSVDCGRLRLVKKVSVN